MSGWQDIVRKVAPTIGAALGGPFGGAATKYLADKFLGKADATEDDIEQAVTAASPEQLVQLRKLDADFKVSMRELGIKEQELAHEDRQSARELFKVNWWPQVIMSAVFIVGYFFVTGLLITGNIEVADEWAQQEVKNLLYILTAMVIMIGQFWFGSSLGSKEKTAALGKPK